MRALIVHKISLYQQLSDVNKITASISASHKTHTDTLMNVIGVCKKYFTNIDVINRDEFNTTSEFISGYDIVFSVGGDGTFLDVSHKINNNIPLFGVNSDPVKSFGKFCFSSSDDFEFKLKKCLNVQQQATNLLRLEYSIDDKVLGLILNEILICHHHPAGTSMYDLEINKKYGKYSETQKSSGIYVATPSGSTGAIKNAGGFIQPNQNSFQFLVRELCFPVDDAVLKKLLLNIDDILTISASYSDLLLSIDGKNMSDDLQQGKSVKIYVSQKPLKTYK